ncbi:hypothetical protein T492DRAFT_1144536 [Pavlovales sp. CCMP2436]|nr:hypothetical protein T492DRAFT_1144536 [Pavlovales sp. CCMP2436]
MLGIKLLSGVGLVLLSLFPAAVASVTYVVEERPVDLGTAGNFAIIAAMPASYVTATDSTVSGSILAGAAVVFVRTVYTRPEVYQTIDHGGATLGVEAMATQAIADFRAAYANVSARAVSVGPSYALGVQLGGLTLTQGTYHSAAALGIAPAGPPGNVIFLGNENSVFIIQVVAHLVFAAGCEIILKWDGTGSGPPVATNVIWQVGSYVTLGAGAILRGTILTAGYISFGAGAQVYGRALAENYVVIPAGLIDGSSAATVSTGFSQTALGAIIGAILGLFLLCGVGAFLLYRRRKDVAFRKTLSKAVAANTSGAAIVAIAPPPAQAERPPGPIWRRSSGLLHVRAEEVDVVV